MKAYTVKAKTENLTLNVEEYLSANELAETNKKRPIMDAWKSEAVSKREIEKHWYGVSSYDEAYDLLKNGWSDKVDQLKTLVNKVAANGNSKRISFQNNVVGFAPVVPLAVMNVPNSMIDLRMKPIKAKVVKIMYNITVHCGTSPETILKNGMKVIESVINLENCGYRCEIYSMQDSCDYSTADVLITKLKDANQPLDLKRVMFPLIHPAMFRVIGFDWQDRCPTAKFRAGRGRAMRYDYGDRMPKIIKEAFGDNWYYFDGSLEKKDTKYIESVLKGEVK